MPGHGRRPRGALQHRVESSVRGAEACESASTITVAILGLDYRMAESGDMDLEERVELEPSDLL